MKRSLPLSTRVFLLAFVPICLTLAISFFLFRRQVEDNVKNGLRQTLLSTQQELAKIRTDAEKQEHSLLGAVVENSSLKAGVVLVRDSGNRLEATTTLEDMLSEMCLTLNYDVLVLFNASNKPTAAVLRAGNEIKAITGERIPFNPGEALLAWSNSSLFRMSSVPINLDRENLGTLAAGRNLAESIDKHGVLTRDGKVILSGFDKQSNAELEASLAKCAPRSADCRAEIRGENFLVVPIESANPGPGFAMWSVESIDAASAPLARAQANSLLTMIIATLAAALLVSLFASRSIALPLEGLIRKLKLSETTGILTGDFELDSSTREVNELASAFNSAAKAVADSQQRLDEAYLEFTKAMAQTLDARDPYTAGHSNRVSDYACLVAEALQLTAEDRRIVKVGANLHDIGKIGVSDAVLQKPGKLTAAEFEAIKKHTVIGKKILEDVSKFRDYLSIVELHHENHDGTGYPWGIAGEKIPIGARIVHVVDAFDAMTTNRPYRSAMSAERALEIIRENSGTQFDPAIVEVFLRIMKSEAINLAEQLEALNANLKAQEEQQEKERLTHDVF